MPSNLNGFEAAYQQLALNWINEQIVSLTNQVASGAPLISNDPTTIAMQYAHAVNRIRAFEDVRAQLIDIEKKLNGHD